MKPIKGLVPVLLFFAALIVMTYLLSLVVMLVTGLVSSIEAFRTKEVELGWHTVGIVLVTIGVILFLFVTKILGDLAILRVGHVGILVVLGERLRKYLLTEGVYWIPPFSSVLDFDSRERQLILPYSEVLSSDNIPIRFKGQLQIRITEPYQYSDVIEPEKTLLEQTLDACRVQMSSHTALEVALNENLSDSIMERIVNRAKGWGISVMSSAISELRLPEDVEKYAQVIRLIRQQNPDISARVVLDALQADRGSIRKLVLESSSLESAATAVVKALFGHR
jgi:regulator of protease activity HflC (stomatin/prohibitin superfamily)